MANRTTANLVKAQAKLLGAFQSSELRFRTPATYLALKEMSAIMFPNYNELRVREDRTIETNYAKRSARALGTGGRTHNHTGTHGDTAVLTPTWITYDDKFAMSLKQADNSLYNAQEQMNQEVSDIIANFMEGYETLATAYLFNNRSTVNVATYNGTLDAVDKVFEIPVINETLAVQTTEIALDANKYPKGATVFCDSVSYGKFLYQRNQGGGNSANLGYQFEMNGLTFVHSIGLGALAGALVSAYSKGFWLVVPNGTVATLPWIPKQNRIGVSTKENEYTNILNPIDGEAYAVHSYETRVDGSLTNGFTQDVMSEYQFSQDISFSKAPLSTANETTILAFGIV
jgi:hypothetical protein